MDILSETVDTHAVTPLLSPVSGSEQAYNQAQSAARNCIERTNGILKRRFPALKYSMRLKVNNVLPVIVATVVLHNIATTLKDDEPPNDQQLDSFLESQRRRGLRVDYDPVEVGPPLANAQPDATGMRRAIIDGHFT